MKSQETPVRFNSSMQSIQDYYSCYKDKNTLIGSVLRTEWQSRLVFRKKKQKTLYGGEWREMNHFFLSHLSVT